MAVVALVLSGLALVVSLLALWIAFRSDKRDADRRHDELTPTITGEWDNDRIVLTLLTAPDGGFESASAELTDATFAGAREGQRLPFNEELSHPWPIGYRWALPQLEEGPERRVHVVVYCSNGEKEWHRTLVVDVPSTEFFVY